MFLLLFVSVFLLLISSSVSASSCSAFPAGYYSPDGVFHKGTPADNPRYSFALNPGFLSCAEVKQLNTYCVARINQYRSGELKFSDGKADPQLGTLKSYVQAMDAAKCQAEISLGDFKLMNQSCGQGAHKNAFHCPKMQGNQAQNVCCPMHVDTTYESVAEALDVCLQTMWDEGLGKGQEQGHWHVMKSPMYTYAVCGISFATLQDSGKPVVLMNQNFASHYEGEVGTLAPTKRPTTLAPSRQPTRKPTTTAVCGNGIVEQGEECDCGDKCEEDNCCNGQTCQYAPKAVCSAQDGCCDTSTCSRHAKGTVCRASADGCDEEETCDGVSNACPVDKNADVGEQCTASAGSTGICSPCKTCVATFDQQCSSHRPDWLKSCSWYPKPQMCGSMWCEREGDTTGGCVGTVDTLFGTKCGDGMSCAADGQCVDNSKLVCPPPTKPKPPTTPTTTTAKPTTTATPTKRPSLRPTTTMPPVPGMSSGDLQSTKQPTKMPTGFTLKPHVMPTSKPTKPTKRPTLWPTKKPTKFPTKKPTKRPV